MLQKIKYPFYTLMGFLINIELLFAADADGIFGKEGVTGITQDEVREGNIHIDDIPKILRNVIDLLLGVAGTITIILIIVGAYKIVFSSVSGEKTKGRETIMIALTGFAISSLAWFIISFILDNFS